MNGQDSTRSSASKTMHGSAVLVYVLFRYEKACYIDKGSQDTKVKKMSVNFAPDQTIREELL
jgi:hypothetical protein